MDNLVLITSVINTPYKPLSYTNIRSVFSRKERFEQTKLTIQSIKKKIPNNKILLVECTDFNEEEKIYFEKECDYILNLWDKKELHNNLFGISKALGEGTQTIEAFKYINANNIYYNNLFKISGRYWFNDKFNYNIFNNNSLVFFNVYDNVNEKHASTNVYKIPNSIQDMLYYFLINNYEAMKACIGYEVLFLHFLKSIKYENTITIKEIGVSGFIAVNGSHYEA
jgi:hypothetical protein